MLDKKVIQKLLEEALETGADFAELFFEDTNQEVIRITSKDVSNISFNNVHGVGVRLIKDNDVVYGYSNQVSEDKVRELVVSLKASFNELALISDRELQVMKYLGKGNTNQQISDLLHISNKTVATYKTRVFDKLGINNIADLILFCRMNNIIES